MGWIGSLTPGDCATWDRIGSETYRARNTSTNWCIPITSPTSRCLPMKVVSGSGRLWGCSSDSRPGIPPPTRPGQGAAPANVALAAGSAGLDRDSVVNVSQVVTLDKGGFEQEPRHPR
jgi:hypothetical protein